MASDFKPCPDCGEAPAVRGLKNVYGLTTGIIIECLNPKCPGIRHLVVNRYAYNKFEWNSKQALDSGSPIVEYNGTHAYPDEN